MKIAVAKINISVKQISTVLISSIFLFHTAWFQDSPCFSSAKINAAFFQILRSEELVHRSLFLEQVLKTQLQNQKATSLQVAEIMKSAISSVKEVSRKKLKSDMFSLAYTEYPYQ